MVEDLGRFRSGIGFGKIVDRVTKRHPSLLRRRKQAGELSTAARKRAGGPGGGARLRSSQYCPDIH
jgi:hypothetical protein